MPPIDEPPNDIPPADRYRRFSIGRMLALTAACGVCFAAVRLEVDAWPCGLLALAVVTIPVLFGTRQEVARGLVVSLGIVGGGFAPIFLSIVLDHRGGNEGAMAILVLLGAAAGGWCAARSWNRRMRRRANRRQALHESQEQ